MKWPTGTKNGRPRKLPLRSDLVELLRQLPRTSELVFGFTNEALRNAWSRMCDHAGLTNEDDLHVHDLRHEAISRVAEIGSNTPGGFSLIDLQHFSGHRDVRMLLRYAHLCTQSLAKRLDEAFNSSEKFDTHRGRRRLKQEAKITVQEMIGCAALVSPVEPVEESSKVQAAVETATIPVADVNLVALTASRLSASPVENVIHVDFTRRAA